MRAWIGIVAFSAMAWLSTGPLMAQDRPPEKPEGTMLGEADHRQNVSQFVVFEFHNPAVGVEGFSTYWPDGTMIQPRS
jgi:hypothetical protein